MNAESIRKSFSDLLDSLASGGFIGQDAKASFMDALERKIQESGDGDGADSSVAAAIEDAASKLKQEFGSMLGDDAEAEKPENPEAGAPGTDVAKLFKGFLSSIPEENLKAFNELVSTLSDEQKELGRSFISGTVGDVVPEKPAEESADPDGGTDAGYYREEIEDWRKKHPEESDGLTDEEVMERAGIGGRGPATDAADDFSEPMKEACGLIGALGRLLEENGLKELGESVMNEASSRLKDLTKKYEKEYERFLKNSIRQMNAQNRKAKLTGGVLGAASRENDYGKVLKELRKKLYMSESSLNALRKEAGEAAEKAEAEKARSAEELKAAAEKERAASEEAADARGELEAARQEADAARKVADEAGKKILKLEEAVKAAERKASESEARAYLTESVSGLSEDLKLYVMDRFRGRGIEEVRSGLSEAVEAYRSERRAERQRLRMNEANEMSRKVNEAAEKNVDEDREDQLVAGFVRIADSFSSKL